MPIRLINASKDLNVGISSLVDFLQKKGIAVEANPNAKITDEQYDVLLAEFDKDKKIRKAALETREKTNRKDEKRETVAIEGYDLPKKEEAPKKKTENETIKTEVPQAMKPQFNVLGTIDLDSLNKKKSEPKKEQPQPKPKPQPQKEEAKVEKKETPQPKPKTETPKAELKIDGSQKPVEKKTEKVEKTEIAPPKKSEEKIEKAAETEVVEKPTVSEPFRLNQNKIESSIVVKGTIDLSTINDRTRPPKKSKSQRKKERLEREQKTADGKPKLPPKDPNKKPTTAAAGTTAAASGTDAEKKKRKRIRPGQVDVTKPNTYAVPKKGDAKKGSGKKTPGKPAVSEEDVQKQVKETLARLTEKKGGKGGAKYRKEKREARAHEQREEMKRMEGESNILQLTEFVTANDLANMMDVPVIKVISACMNLGVMVAINQRLDAETINIVAEEFGFETKYVSADVSEAIAEEEDNPEDLLPRPPIVTVMGHVDHGKTSLLDSIRQTNVIAGEAGGITQHIGAYNVQLPDGRHITFLDTPGHEAFTAMRARGAKVTDVAIILVAADDNVMPQTIEAINHASAAGVPIIFAINKIDKPGANPEKIKETLSGMNYLVEDWGGKYQSQEISAKQGIGVPELLEKILLEADMLELKANPNRRAKGTVIESSLDKGRGYVSTVLVENGTLKQGDILLAGSYFGRVKAMFNERNQRIEEAGPSAPALVLGLNGAPQAGDMFNVMETEQEARAITNRRDQLQREQSLRTQKMLTLDDIGRRIAIGSFQQLNIIVKGDVDGSVEALSDSLIRLSTEEIKVNVVHKAVGQISESDVNLAATSDAIIIGFQVRPSVGARREAEKAGVDIRLYSIIYDAIEEVKLAMEGMLSPDIKEEITGNVEIREVFKITKVGTVAGCMVRDGKIKRNNKIRVIRDGIVVFTGELDSLKRFKEDVREVASGYECGMSIRNFNDIQVGDVIEAYEEREEKRTL